MPPMFIHPIHLDPPIYLESLNRVLFSYFIKCFPSLKRVKGGCQTQVVSTYPQCSWTPYIWTPLYAQQILIGYLFCYNIKCFLNLETVKGGCQTQQMSIYPLCSYTPFIQTCPVYLVSFNRVFILLFYKMFSYFRGSHEGLSDLGAVHMPPYVHRPHIFGYPPYVQQIWQASYFCYNIKCFLTLETVKGGCQTQEVSIYPLCSYTPYIQTPPIYLEKFEQGIYFVYFIKCFPILEAVMRGCQTQVVSTYPQGSQTPYIWTPLYVQKIFNRVFILL